MILLSKDQKEFIIGSQESKRLESNNAHEFLRRELLNAKSMDVATGYFEFSAFEKLGVASLGSVDHIRILIGNGSSANARNRIVDLNTLSETIKSIGEEAKESDSQPEFGKAIYQAFKEGRVEFKIFNSTDYLFHPKLYIIKSKSKQGKKALVGSSNFTRNGISSNIELNVIIEDDSEVKLLQEWFEFAWKLGTDVTKKIDEQLPRDWADNHHHRPYTVFLKAMSSLFNTKQKFNKLSDNWLEKDETIAKGNLAYSQMWWVLDEYQREAFYDLLGYAENYGGAFLCDGVGLGKTYTGLMLIEKYALFDNKRVLLISPKSVHDSVWTDKLQTMLGHVPAENIEAIKTTDLTGFDKNRIESFRDTEMIIIDEAHHFRNPKSKRHIQLQSIIDTGKEKQVFLLTATPLNNDLYDLYNLIKLFSKAEDNFKSVGILSIDGHFRELRDRINQGKDIAQSKIVREVIVQRSRSYVKESMKIEKQDSVFPEPAPPLTIQFKAEGEFLTLLSKLETAFKSNIEKGKNDLLNFSIYNPIDHFTGTEEEKKEHLRKGSVRGLMGSGLLKRLESSVWAFKSSCYNLLLRYLTWLKMFDSSKSGKEKIRNWEKANEDILSSISPDESSDGEDDALELGFDQPTFEFEVYPKNKYDINGIISEAYEDLDVIAEFIHATEKIDAENDVKIDELVNLLSSDKMSASGKVVIFTEFVSTAMYLEREFSKKIRDRVIAVIHSKTSEDRRNVVTRFSPYYNGSSANQLACSCNGNSFDSNGNQHPEGCKPEDEIDILISTDVLAEGLNLQDSVRLINYDIPWNPVRLMQRIGRIDRRLNPDVEKKIVSSHPARKKDRKRIVYWNFIPPQKLEELVGLQKVVEKKFTIIASLLGIEGGFGLTKSQNLIELHNLYTNSDFSLGSSNLIDILDPLRLEYNRLLQSDGNMLASSTITDQSVTNICSHKEGPGNYVFFCYLFPRKIDNDFDFDKGECKWYLYNINSREILERRADVSIIYDIIKTEPSCEQKQVITDEMYNVALRNVEEHIKINELFSRGMTMGTNPKLLCSMTIGGGD